MRSKIRGGGREEREVRGGKGRGESILTSNFFFLGMKEKKREIPQGERKGRVKEHGQMLINPKKEEIS